MISEHHSIALADVAQALLPVRGRQAATFEAGRPQLDAAATGTSVCATVLKVLE